MEIYRDKNIILEKFGVVFVKLQGLKHKKVNYMGFSIIPLAKLSFLL
jgi:hypothetical protein